jgi:DNA polymerase I-like protein with 3'-5' exonuclease and polymerase domains
MVWSKDMGAIRDVVAAAFTARREAIPRTDSGEVATEKDVLLRAGDARLEALAELSGLDKIRDTYLPILERGTEVPINARFNVLVASGRTSCSSPNLQNVPGGSKVGGTREVFVARPGCVWISVDYDTLELRALAQVLLELFGQSRMADVLKEGRDLHIDMGAQLLGISYDEFVARRKAGDKAIKKARDYAKIVNFGLPGGMGAASLVDYARKSPAKIIIAPDEARELVTKYRNAWPEMVEFFAYAGKTVGDGNGVFHDPVTGFTRGGVGYCDFCNSHFQHRAAFGAKAAVCQVSYECYVDAASPLYGARLVNFVHDECLVEVEEERAHEAAQRLAAVMVDCMARFVKDVPVTASPSVMRRWSKSAEAAFDRNGRLIPWDDVTPASEAAA